MTEKLPLIKIKKILEEGFKVERDRRKSGVGGNELPSSFSVIFDLFNQDIKNIDKVSEDFLREIFEEVINTEKKRMKIIKENSSLFGQSIVQNIIDIDKIESEKLKVLKKDERES